MTPTQPTPQGPPPGPPGPPSGRATPPPPTPGATPRKSGGRGWLVGFIVASVLLIAALVFGIFSFIGKNDESDKKDEAQTELTATQKELEQTKAELGTSEAAGSLLGELVNAGERSADDLKSCADSARQLRSNIVAALNAVQAGGDVNVLVDGINAQISENDTTCSTSDSSYQEFRDALAKLESER